MSLKMFLLSTFGGIKETSLFEKEQEQLKNDYKEFVEVEKSEELKSFLELEKEVLSESFLANKKKIQELNFKGSPEESQELEYNKLHKNKSLKKYYIELGSSELKRYYRVKESEELEQYHELKIFVEEGEYTSEKEKYKSEVFKGSEEEMKTKEFAKLEKNKKLRNYLSINESRQLNEFEELQSSDEYKTYRKLLDKKTARQLVKEEKQEFAKLKSSQSIVKVEKFKKSRAYKDYLEISKSKLPARYSELKAEVEKAAFKERVNYLKDGKKFEKTEAFKKYTDYQKLKNSEDIRFYLKYPKSSGYKNYLHLDKSNLKSRYEDLKNVVKTDEFVERKAYLLDETKWEKTDEYQKEVLYQEMLKRPHITKYLSYVGTDKLDFYKNWGIVFEDQFDKHKLDKKKWTTVSPWAPKTVERNISQEGDLQGFTDGSNISLDHGNLQIETRKEKNKSLVWKSTMGFVEEDMEYTSGLISSSEDFTAEYGILEAKVKYAPSKGIVDVFYLGSENENYRLNLMEIGSVNRLGISGNGNTEDNSRLFTLKKLKANSYYIFRIEWSADKVIWKINDKEVFDLSSDIPTSPMHINLTSLVLEKVNKLPHNFTVDWIRFYQKKS